MHLWIWIEEGCPGLPVLVAGDAYLGLVFREGVTFEEAKDLTGRRHRMLAVLTYTKFITQGVSVLRWASILLAAVALCAAAWMTRYEHSRAEASSSTFAEWRWDRWRHRACLTYWDFERRVTSTYCDLDWLPRRRASVPRRDSSMAADTTRR
jgi:hypothetical protein